MPPSRTATSDCSRLVRQRLARLNALSPPLRACVVADIKRTAQLQKAKSVSRDAAPTGGQRYAWAWALVAITGLSSCGTPKPPAPPTIDATQRRPANDPLELEHRRSRIQLHNERLERQLLEQRAQLAAMTIPVALQQPTTPANPPPSPPPSANRVYVVTFGFGKSDLAMPAEQEQRLLSAARNARHIVIRGRTDGTSDTASESRVARQRAARMRDFLVSGGVEPSRVRITHQAIGDHLADNASDEGRALNRRVEVELYPALPDVQVMGRANKSST